MGKLTIKEEIIAPQTPSNGNRSIYPKSDGWYEIDDQGTERKVFSETIHGLNYQFAKENFEDANNIQSWRTYASISYPAGIAVAGHVYEIVFSSIIRNSVTTRNHLNRITVDSIQLEEVIGFELKDSGSDVRQPIGYTYIIDAITLNGLGGLINYEFMPQQAGDTATIHSCTLTFKRVE